MSSSPLSTFARLLRLARQLPTPKERADAVTAIRAGFRANADERDAARVSELLASAAKRVSYLRMVTRRAHGDVDAAAPAKRYVVQDGEVVCAGEGEGDLEGTGAAARVASRRAGAMDAAAFSKHAASLRRFRFEDHAVRPRSPFSG